MVSDDALEEIKKSVASMSMAQRHEIGCERQDIYFSFPFQVGIMFDEDTDVQRRWVEITMVFHVLRGVKEMVDREQSVSLNIGMDPAYQDKFSICNYRFIKEYTKDQETDWVVNKLNHFKPIDLLPEKSQWPPISYYFNRILIINNSWNFRNKTGLFFLYFNIFYVFI